jgi:hypothetical protein
MAQGVAKGTWSVAEIIRTPAYGIKGGRYSHVTTYLKILKKTGQ